MTHPLRILTPRVTPPWQGVGRRIESLTRKACLEFELLENSSGIAVALSGGKDSLAMLMMLAHLLGHGFPKIPLYAIHVSGEFSCGAGVQLPFIQSICDQLDVPLIVRESKQTLETLECYSCSRERRKLLFDTAKSVNCDTVAFGHHRDDLIQTTLLNLLHKAEFAGLLPKLKMQHYGITIIRPLIYVPEDDIRSFAQQNHFARVVCQCPVGQNSKRKQVEQLLVEMEELFPHVRANLAQATFNYGSDKAKRP